MSGEPIDEDFIDVTALQAQIDLSMAFAQSLVSSWIEPQKLPTQSRRAVLEAELLDHMRRPPRLGVGAPIPETRSLAREAVRLRGQLTGGSSKRQREEASKGNALPSDDEKESRAGAIRKKVKTDPFDSAGGKKKKKKAVDGRDNPSPTADAKAREEGPVISTKSKAAPEQTGLGSSHTLRDRSAKTVGKTSLRATPIPNVRPEQPAPQAPPIPPLRAPPSPTASSTPSRVAFLKNPILNLGGSPPGDGRDADTGALHKPKKKRKRRKKKKHAQDGLTGPTTSSMP